LALHESGTLRSTRIVEHWLSWKVTCQSMACKNIRHKTMPLGKFTGFQECYLLNGSNMYRRSSNNPIDANRIFGQFRHATDVIDDLVF